MATNGISTSTVAGNPVATKLSRRDQKLTLASTKRASTSTYGTRTLHTISGTHTGYVSTSTTSTISGSTSPAVGHPWS